MSILIKGIEMPKSCYVCPFKNHDGMWVRCIFTGQNVEPETRRETKASSCPFIEVPQHGRLIDADKIGLTNFEIILCQKGNPFKNALEMLLEKIEKAPTIIPADGKDIKVPTRKEEV